MSRRKFVPHILASVVLISPAIAGAKDIRITPEQIRHLNIQIETAQQANMETVAILPGTVVPPLNSRLVAAAPFAGTVTQVHVLPGQHVAKGMPLITVSSRDLLDVQGQLAQSEAELQAADAIARRRRSLADKNFQNPTLADEAEAQVAKVRAVLDQHKRATALNGIITQADGQYAIPAPADGNIAETLVTPGEKVDAMAGVVTIDTSNELWVQVQVPVDVIPFVKPNDIVRIADGPTGRVVSVGGSLERITRSAVMYAAIPANSNLLPGQIVSVSVLRPTVTGSVNVPASAVVRLGDQPTVFVRSQTGFKLVPVQLRGKSPSTATISGPLSRDAQVAASGLPQLERLSAGE
ncbi:MAG: efflux RND transporter periplasmic adaptor subunit [Proteobacteria bacterium]|nr:efflux RND transporter periplasmic adaptor subunit [Pseudomonadota bacterium]